MYPYLPSCSDSTSWVILKICLQEVCWNGLWLALQMTLESHQIRGSLEDRERQERRGSLKSWQSHVDEQGDGGHKKHTLAKAHDTRPGNRLPVNIEIKPINTQWRWWYILGITWQHLPHIFWLPSNLVLELVKFLGVGLGDRFPPFLGR